MEFEPMLTPREKSPLPKMSPEEDRTRDAVDSEPKHYQLRYSGPEVPGMTGPGNMHGDSGTGTQVCRSQGGRLNHWASEAAPLPLGQKHARKTVMPKQMIMTVSGHL